MARLVVFKDQEPKEIVIGGQTVKICRCGLTKDANGFCDGTHNITKDEDVNATYFYDKDLHREIVDLITDEDFDDEGCGCGCNHDEKDGDSCACGSHSCGCGGHHHN